jgi:hypothetical protein
VRNISCLTSCYVAAIAMAATSALADEQIGNVVQRHYNGALGQRVLASDQDDLYFNRDVFAGELVRTPASASTVIRFQDKTQIQVGANSSLTIDRFVYDPSSGTGAGAIKFSTGIFRFITGSIRNKAAFLLTTPTASLAIRGTKFIVAVAADGSTTVGVIDGEVDVAPCGNSAVARENAGHAVRVNTSCSVGQVAMSAVPTDPATISDYAADNSTGVTVGGSPANHPGNSASPRSAGGTGDGGSPSAGSPSGSSGGSISAAASASSASSANGGGSTARSSANASASVSNAKGSVSANASASSSASVSGSGNGNGNGNNSSSGHGNGRGSAGRP